MSDRKTYISPDFRKNTSREDKGLINGQANVLP